MPFTRGASRALSADVCFSGLKTMIAFAAGQRMRPRSSRTSTGYQFAVTVDEVRHGVTLVIRGADLLASTGRQVLLAEMLGRPTPPVFLHHPLIMGRRGEKLSKSAGDTGVRELRAQGRGPEDVIGRAAAAVGLIASPRAIRASEVASLFLYPLDL
jgi:glutamyl/glutaminyl-tRNA synthetase